MLDFIKKIRNNKDHKVLISNFLYLSIFQGLNLVLPLITLPFLVRVLGVEYFGLLAFATAFTTYFQIITDYGFNSTATRDISKVIRNKELQDEIFNDVMSCKLFLLACSFIFGALLVFSFDKFGINWDIYLYSFGSVIGQVLFPIWFFQGVQKMRYITYINLVTKVIFTIAIFVFVNEKSDYYLVPIFNSLGFFSAGLFSLYMIRKEFGIYFKFQPFRRIREQLKKGLYVFLSEFKISLFTNTNIMILGLLVGNNAVGYFTSAEKLARAIGNFQVPISNALFPYIAKEMEHSKLEAIKKVSKLTKIGSLCFLVGIIFCFIFSKEIILLVYGKEMYSSIILFKILIIIPLASFLDTMFGKQILLNLGKDNLYFRVILYATILNVSINIFLTYFYKEIGTAIALNITQVFIVIGMWFFAAREIKKIKIQYSKI